MNIEIKFTRSKAKDALGVQVTNNPKPEDAATRQHEGFDLLRVPGVRRLILWGGFPYVFQVAMLVVFVALAVISWGVYTPGK